MKGWIVGAMLLLLAIPTVNAQAVLKYKCEPFDVICMIRGLLAAGVGIGYSTYDECLLAKKYYQDMGCTCPVEGWDCNYYSAQNIYVLHCGSCPSKVGGEYPHYYLGRCSWDEGLCVDAQNKGLLSCGGTWSCDTSDWSHNCVCTIPTTTTTAPPITPTTTISPTPSTPKNLWELISQTVT